MIFDEDGVPLVSVHTCWDDGEAAVVDSYLRAHGIEALPNSEVPHSVLPIDTNGLGKIEILVKQQDARQARALLAERNQDQDTPASNDNNDNE